MKATKVEIEVLKSMAESLKFVCNTADVQSKMRILEATAITCSEILKKYAEFSEVVGPDEN